MTLVDDDETDTTPAFGGGQVRRVADLNRLRSLSHE